MPNIRQLFFILSFILALGLLPSQQGTALPAPDMTILSPGQGSVLTPPIHLNANIHTEEVALIRISLIDHNNTLLARQLRPLDIPNEAPSYFSSILPYEIPTGTTPALLTVAIYDDYHRPLALRSVSLTLQSAGATNIQPGSTLQEWLSITHPIPGQAYSGGQIDVEGLVTPLTVKPIHFELITETGRIIGSRQMAVKTPGESNNFTISIPYTAISTTQEVRLVIRQTADVYVANVILDSLLIRLLP